LGNTDLKREKVLRCVLRNQSTFSGNWYRNKVSKVIIFTIGWSRPE